MSRSPHGHRISQSTQIGAESLDTPTRTKVHSWDSDFTYEYFSEEDEHGNVIRVKRKVPYAEAQKIREQRKKKPDLSLPIGKRGRKSSDAMGTPKSAASSSLLEAPEVVPRSQRFAGNRPPFFIEGLAGTQTAPRATTSRVAFQGPGLVLPKDVLLARFMQANKTIRDSTSTDLRGSNNWRQLSARKMLHEATESLASSKTPHLAMAGMSRMMQVDRVATARTVSSENMMKTRCSTSRSARVASNTTTECRFLSDD